MSLGGNVYLLAFTDDYSRKTWVYTTKTRTESELYDRFKAWEQHFQKESGQQLIALRADNRSEFHKLGGRIERENGIKMEFTVPYIPEQNDIAERLNRAIFTMVRAMLFKDGLP